MQKYPTLKAYIYQLEIFDAELEEPEIAISGKGLRGFFLYV